MISSLFESCFGIYFNWCYKWDKTHSHLHYLHCLDSVDILGSCDDDSEVDDVWLNSRPNLLLLVSNPHCRGPGGLYMVHNI